MQLIQSVGDQQGNLKLNWGISNSPVLSRAVIVNVCIKEFFSLIQTDDVCHYLIRVCSKRRLQFRSVRNQHIYLDAFSPILKILLSQFSKNIQSVICGGHCRVRDTKWSQYLSCLKREEGVLVAGCGDCAWENQYTSLYPLWLHG